MDKEGLKAAIGFTKFLLTLSGGAVAFIIQENQFTGHPNLKLLSLSSLICLTVCVASGLLLYMRGSVMLANRDYNLEEAHIKFWGQTNVLSFGLGFLLLAIAVGIQVLSS